METSAWCVNKQGGLAVYTKQPVVSRRLQERESFRGRDADGQMGRWADGA